MPGDDSTRTPFLDPPRQVVIRVDYTKFNVISLVANSVECQKYKLDWVLLPMKELRKKIIEFLPLVIRDDQVDPNVAKRLLYKPLFNFTKYRPVMPEDEYPHHPLPENIDEISDLSECIRQYSVYWACMCRSNLLEVLITDQEHHKTHPLLIEKIRSIQESMMPLISIFVETWKESQTIPTDIEVSMIIQKYEDELPIYGRWMRYPDFHNEYIPKIEENIKKFIYHTSYEIQSPAARIKKKLTELNWWTEILEQGFHEDFEKARKLLKARFSSEERTRIYQQEFKHFQLEKMDPSYVFDGQQHSIIFACLWRINKAYELLDECMRHGKLFNIGIKKIVTPLDDQEQEQPKRRVRGQNHYVQQPNSGNPFCVYSLDHNNGPTENSRKQGVASCFLHLIEELCRFDPNHGVPFAPSVNKQPMRDEIIPARSHVFREECAKIVALHGKIQATWVSEMLEEAIVTGSAKIKKYMRNAGNGEALVFCHELGARGLRNAVAAVDRFKDALKIVSETKSVHSDAQQRNLYMHRWRLSIPKDLREQLYYYLKLFIATHNDMMMAILQNKSYSDADIIKKIVHGNYSVCAYDYFYPSPHRHVSEAYLPNHGPLLNSYNFFDKPCKSKLPIVKAYYTALKPSLYQKSPSREDPPQATDKTASYFAWLGRVRLVFEMATTKDSNTYVDYEHMLRAYIGAYYRTPQQIAEWAYAYPQTCHNNILGALMCSIRSSPMLYEAISFHLSPNQQLRSTIAELNDGANRIVSSSVRTKHQYLRADIEKIITSNLLKPKRKNRTSSEGSKKPPSKRLRTSVFKSNDYWMKKSLNDEEENEPKLTAANFVVENVKFCDNVYAVVEHWMQLQPISRDGNMMRKTQSEYIKLVIQCYILSSKLPKNSPPGTPKPLRPLAGVRLHLPEEVSDAVISAVNSIKTGYDFDVKMLASVVNDLNKKCVERGEEPRYRNMQSSTCAKLAYIEHSCRSRSPEKLSAKLQALEPYEKYMYYLACNIMMQKESIRIKPIPDAVEVAHHTITAACIVNKRPDALNKKVDGIIVVTLNDTKTHMGKGLNSIGAKSLVYSHIDNTYINGLKTADMLTKQRENWPQAPVSVSIISNIVELNKFSATPGFIRKQLYRHGDGCGASKHKMQQQTERLEQDKVTTYIMQRQGEVTLKPSGPPVMNMESSPRPMVLPDKKASNKFYISFKNEKALSLKQELIACGETIAIKAIGFNKKLLVSIPSTYPTNDSHWLKIKKTDSIFMSTCCGHQVTYSLNLFGPWVRTYCGHCKNKQYQIALLPHCYSCPTPVVDTNAKLHLIDEELDRFWPIWFCQSCAKALYNWLKHNRKAPKQLLDAVLLKKNTIEFIDDKIYTGAIIKQLGYKSTLNVMFGSGGAQGRQSKRVESMLMLQNSKL